MPSLICRITDRRNIFLILMSEPIILRVVNRVVQPWRCTRAASWLPWENHRRSGHRVRNHIAHIRTGCSYHRQASSILRSVEQYRVN